MMSSNGLYSAIGIHSPDELEPEPLLSVRNLQKHYHLADGVLGSNGGGVVKAVDGVSFKIKKGQTVSLVGESGCGKTTTAKSVLLVERATGGTISFAGQDVSTFDRLEMRRFRRSVQAVFQDPFSSLNPRMKVLDIIAEPIDVHQRLSSLDRKSRVAELMNKVGLGISAGDSYPHEFSGGQRQRIAIARAMALQPELIVLDEPVSSLDVSVRAQVTNLLRDLQDETGQSYLLIAHDLAMVHYMSDVICVMYLGKIVEMASSEELYLRPKHPYTQALFAAALPYDPSQPIDNIVLGGEIPSPLAPPSGCHFHPRCPHAMQRCKDDQPQLQELASDHHVACHLHENT